jgi:hypothetical protein
MTDPDIKRLYKQRASIKGQLTSFKKYLRAFQELDLQIITKSHVNELNLRLTKIQNIFNNFDVVQSEIEIYDENPDEQILLREDIESQFYSVISETQELLTMYKKFSCSKEQLVPNIKLPTISLKVFNGDREKWLEFHDTYCSLIHYNVTIDAISKFHYLKSSLEGIAANVIKSIPVSSENYIIAWDLLCERYNNKRLLINHHLKALFSLERINSASERSIRFIIDTVMKNLRSLETLGEPTDKWDTIVIYLVSAKLDASTSMKWEEYRNGLSVSPTLEHFYNFLRDRATILENVQAGHTYVNDKGQKQQSTSLIPKAFVSSSSSPPHQSSSSSSAVGLKCQACNGDHKLYTCEKFKAMTIAERNDMVYKWKICANCLRSGHFAHQCNLGGCRVCKRKHNSLLHRSNTLVANNNPSINNSNATCLPSVAASEERVLISKPSDNPMMPSVTMSAIASSHVLLSTALVEVMCSNNKKIVLRALLDSGSQSSFLTESAKNKLGDSITTGNSSYVSGLNNTSLQIKERCNISITSMNKEFHKKVMCLVVPHITDHLPNFEVRSNLGISASLSLADPNFSQPGEIDLLLGADVFWDIIETDRIKLGKNKPILQDSRLGWIVSGPIGDCHIKGSQQIVCNFSQEIKDILSKFWEVEEVPSASKVMSIDNEVCEDIFTNTTSRLSNGQFCVHIPLKESEHVLGDSFQIAKGRFLNNERRMSRDPSLKQRYSDFINEYKNLGHLSEIPKPSFGYYLPHHAVLREQSETTKLRVVFDASAKTSTNISFNDIQHIGPSIQDDLFSILLRFRQHRFVFSADVEKMYRCIQVHPTQRHLQLILWRDNDTDPLKCFQLNTVTYGTASAPFLATRCLKQLAIDCDNKDVAEVIEHDFYMDDILTGAPTMSELKNMCLAVTNQLNSASFPLRKFRTNAPSIFDSTDIDNKSKNLSLSAETTVLGLKWHPSSDTLQFPVKIESEFESRVTKRTILSNSARIFDPLGLLSIITIIPKVILQRLWLTKLGWDDKVPLDIYKQWVRFVKNLVSLSSLNIPRFILSENPITIQLHTFSDASQMAYAACVYIRTIDASGECSVHLLCAKTKVASLKPISIPRLELNGALLAARLTHKVIKSLRLRIDNQFFWTDSSVVLGWISSDPKNHKTFIANRIAEIQNLTSITN